MVTNSPKMRVQEIRWVRAGDLKPHPMNWRRHPGHQRKALRGILQEIGFTGVLMAVERGESLLLVDGHLRRDEAPDLKVPVAILDLDDVETEKALATHDPIAAMAQADKDVLLGLLDHVEFQDESVNALLEALANDSYQALIPLPPLVISDSEDEQNTNKDLEEVEVDSYVPFSKRGQVWALGNHRLMCGDSTDSKAVECVMAMRLAQAIITDPPYGVAYDGAHLSSGTFSGLGRRTSERLEGDNSPTLYNKIFNIFDGITDDKAVAFVFFAGVLGFPVYDAVERSSWKIRALIIWAKNHAQFGSMGSQYKTKHEPILYLFKKGHSTRWFGATNETTVWEYDRASKNEFHITQKPVELFMRPIANHVEPNGIVFDGFLGSGTTLIACEKLDRICYGMEIEPRYVDVCIRRWKTYTGKKAELLYG